MTSNAQDPPLATTLGDSNVVKEFFRQLNLLASSAGSKYVLSLLEENSSLQKKLELGQAELAKTKRDMDELDKKKQSTTEELLAINRKEATKQASHTTSYHDIRRQMMDALDDEDKKDGFLYIYEVKGNKGFVKIGYTTRSINKRHDEWIFDCNRELVSLFPIGATEARRVPHAHRVETLCHAELSHRNNVIYCDGCLNEHLEWFEVSPSEAIAVVRKWTAWIETKPYLSDGSLKEEEARKSADIDRFMDTMSKNTGDIRTTR